MFHVRTGMFWAVAAAILVSQGTVQMAVAGGPDLQGSRVRLPLMEAAPSIDGKIQEAEWAGAARMVRFGRGASLSPQEASFWVGADEQNLYIAVVSQTPPGGELLDRVNPMPGDTDARAYRDDSIELVLDPRRESGGDQRELYHAIINAKGALYDQVQLTGGGGQGWRGHWNIANQVIDDRWHFEAAIPWSDLGVKGSVLGRSMGLRVGRNWQQSVKPVQSEWSPLGGPYLTTETMPVVTWDGGAPVTQVRTIQDPDTRALHYQVAIRNPHDQPLSVQALLLANPENSASRKINPTVRLSAGQTKRIELVEHGYQPNETIVSKLRITSADQSKVYYRREFSWRLGRPDQVWKTDRDAAKKIATSYSYFPHHHKMKVRVNLSGFEDRDQIQAVHLQVRRKQSQEVIATTPMPPVEEDVTRMIWGLGELSEGQYELTVNFEGVPSASQVFSFVRRKFPWEDNDLGKSEVVVAPFEPIKVDNQTVHTVQRVHTMSDVGLWQGLESKGESLFTGPMRLEVKTGDRVIQAEGDMQWTTRTKTEVGGKSAWSAGPLEGVTDFRWDYDGMMKTGLTLRPTDKPIDSLTLVIPLKDQSMPLMHACTDGIRFNYAGKVPPGEGRVWAGSEAASNSIIGSYVPYLWVGGAERGFSVFGENDKGWITSEKVDCQELVRRPDGTLELRLNLIAKPTKISQKRRIELGFLATPVKPMPDDWRLWTVDQPLHMGPRNTYQQVWLGSGFYWGTLTPASDIYPRDHDLSLWREFARTRRTGEVDQAFIKQWLAGYDAPSKHYASVYEPHIRSGFRSMQRQADAVLVYTNARGVRLDTPEGQTFLGPWHRDVFPQHDWPYGGGVAYAVDPVESFRDYTVWYYKQMYETFVDAIYWDDIFMQSNFDTITTNAYERTDGHIQPSSGVFNMRQLIRRAAVLGHEMGKRNGNMVHMTNTAIAPILAFARTNLTWEDRRGLEPIQQRFTRAYIRAESIGRQFGNVPFILHTLIRGEDGPKKDWAVHTAAGVMLTHEMKPTGARWRDYWSNYKRLAQFGYGKPNVKVFNYWQEDYPLKVEGTESSSLVLSKKAQAMIVICDYTRQDGEGDRPTPDEHAEQAKEVRLTLDRQALGLGPSLNATDVNADKSYEVSEAGVITIPLNKHDFKILRIESQTKGHDQ